jgi:hypothetical protein
VTVDQVYEALLEAELIHEGATPNSSGEFVAQCFECDKKKLFVKAGDDDNDNGVYFCQACENKGSQEDFLEKFEPQSRQQQVYAAFHEYAIRKLLANDDAYNTLADRDFNEDDIKNFGFGYVGKNWTKELIKKGVTEDELQDCGFISPSGVPVFWNHIIIPYIERGKYTNFKGRCLDEKAKIKYIGLQGHASTIYGISAAKKSGRVLLTEGEFKACYAISNGYSAIALSGANNFQKYVAELDEVEDLWIVLDSDQPTAKVPLGVGQTSALKLAKSLSRCHLVTLPLGDGDKVGLDDYLRAHSPDEFEQLLKTADYYEEGLKQKPRSLTIIMDDWRERAKSAEVTVNYNIGMERMNSWLNGLENEALGYVIGSAHHGKSTFLRAMAYNLYWENPELYIDYYSNDDSLRATLGQFVARAGRLDSNEAKQPLIAYADDKAAMKKWEAATAKIKSMGDRMRILDRTYRVDLETIYADFYNWRQANPDGHRVLLIDGFRQQAFRATKNSEDKNVQNEKKSEFLKKIAQECNVPVVSTIQPPKLYGKRPRSFDISHGNDSEFDADIVWTAYIEAQLKGLPGTELKMLLEYDDAPSIEVPYIEIGLVKNKPAQHLDMDVMTIDPRTSLFEEIDDDAHSRAVKAIYESESKKKE